MSYCLNPHCQQPQNLKNSLVCSTCQTQLLLKQRYRAIKPIGQGGFGRTLLAVDESKPLKPPCVIKQFLVQAQGTDNNQKAVELFQQEALRLSNLGSHNQIPNLLEYLTQDEHQYLVQEYIDGYDLAEILKEQGTFNEAQIWELLNSLLPVLEFIHKNDVIHRDIKPQNIIRNKNGKLNLVDFGAAKVVTGTAILQTGTSIGTPEFVAPEQLRGKANYSSDLYSLGTTCIYLLTGISPFDLFDIYENNWVWREYLVDNPVSNKLSIILDKLIENAISRRYQSASEVLTDINSHQTLNFENKPLSYTNISKAIKSTWQCINSFTAHSGSINSIAVSFDRMYLMSGSDDCTIKLWDINTNSLVWTFENHGTIVRSVAFNPAIANLVAMGDDNNIIKLWQVNSGQTICTLKGHTGWFTGVSSVIFSPNGQILVSAGGDKTVKVWNVNSGKIINTLRGHDSSVCSVAISPDGKFIASGSTDTRAILWDLNGNIVHIFYHTEILAAVRFVAFSPDSQIIATASEDSTIKLWQVNTGEQICTFNGHSSGLRCVTFNPKQQIFASSSDDSDIKLWDTNTKQEICTLTGHSGKVNSLVFSSDGKTLYSGSDDKTIKIWQYQ
ncbi:MAG: serine/threonine protein kinase [Rivularia sp. (in: Bacteria)]|nr:serine/threonine protein kinase [Rivularia sp. MS3]